MSRKDKITTDHLREQATEAGKVAKHFAEHGKEWAGPKVEAAYDWAAPKVDKAWRSGVQAAAPKVADYAEKSRGAVDVAHDKIVDDVIPKVIAAMEEAAKAAKGGADGLQSKAHAAVEAAEKAVAKQEKAAKSGSALGKTLGWVLVGSAVAGAGVLIWRRTQPVDDPWAEEYWDDAVAPGASETAAPAAAAFGSHENDTASAADKAKHVADEAGNAVADAAKNVSDKVDDATDSIKDKVDDAKND